MPRVPTALYLLVAHIDDIIRSIAICNDAYKFAANSYSIWSKFAVDNKVMVMSHPEAVRKLHDWRTDFDKTLKRIAFITYESNSPLDSGISSVFGEDDVPRSTLCALIELPIFTVDPSRRPALPPLLWSRCGVSVLLPRPPLFLD